MNSPHTTTETPLDTLALPLRGSHLIEASAGTGKTFTIAMLYVRLVLGHGGDTSGHGRALTPPEILVVTFTEAATQELRDRIRARLAQAAAYFRQSPGDDQTPNSSDPLSKLRHQYPPHEWAACARKLEVAAEWMDESAVSTIHGWCNRMLHEHAFDSLSLFTQTLETDPTDLRAEVVRDYWRQWYYPLKKEELQQVMLEWDHPGALEKDVRPVLDRVDRLPPADSPSAWLAQCHHDRLARLQQLKAPWPQWVAEWTQYLEEARAHKRFRANILRPNSYTAWLTTIHEWATSDQEELDLTDSAWDRLTVNGIAAAWKEDQPQDHPALHHVLLTELAGLRTALQQLPHPRPGLLSHAAHWIDSEFKATQRRRSQLGFDDLLRNLDTALNGPHGERLSQTIRQQFPVALIDEFQDTDPVQYRIFERIYATPPHESNVALILIGDPKQAIYAFRGADIHTYLKARHAVGNRLYTLGTNFRSTPALVEATNHCFLHVEQQPASSGAFLFRRNGLNPVPFHCVEARGRPESLLIQGSTPAALQLTVLPGEGKRTKASYLREMAQICASQLATWLNLGVQGQAGFVRPDQAITPLKPSDIAILVNNQKEATSVRRALAQRGIRSVYLSDKDTVYDTPQATEVYRWLLACADPDNERLRKAALCTHTLGLDFPALEALHTDERVGEQRLMQFKTYHDLWRQQGVLPMIRRILIDFNCTTRLLHQPPDALGQSGERILTDVLHLAELLQQASSTLEGDQTLIRFLAEHIADPSSQAEDKKLRLESDADLVQVVTIHKSKGLEYPLVMLPFICTTRPTKADDVPITWHDEAGNTHVSLQADADTLARADAERLGEEVRKLYVALTRARHHTWLGLAQLENTGISAIGHLLGWRDTSTIPLTQTLHDFAKGHSQIEVIDTPTQHNTRYIEADTTPPRGQACRPRRPAREHWWISSYSHLPVGGHRSTLPQDHEDTPRAENWRESQREQDPITALPTTREASASSHPMHRFPKGAQPGTFLHDLMEWCADAGFNTVLNPPHALRELITQRCATQGWNTWVDPLCDWLQQLLTTPLPLGERTLCLQQVTTARAEMEFWIETRRLDLQALDQAVIRHTLDGRPRPGMSPDSLTGMLKGFMDLVLEHEGRYYVVDYKSNWLGPDETAYTAASMDEAIRAHRYDLQYVLYLFALHRLLTSRLPDYDYDRHVGGAAYLFLRGIAAPTAGVHFDRPPKALMQELDRLFAGETGDAS